MTYRRVARHRFADNRQPRTMPNRTARRMRKRVLVIKTLVVERTRARSSCAAAVAVAAVADTSQPADGRTPRV